MDVRKLWLSIGIAVLATFLTLFALPAISRVLLHRQRKPHMVRAVGYDILPHRCSGSRPKHGLATAIGGAAGNVIERLRF